MAGRRHGKEVAGHKSKHRCKHCKGKHTTSEHWSHAANTGAKSYKHSFGGTKGGRRRRKGTYHGSPGDFRAGAAAIKAGKLGRSRQTRKGALTRAERSAMNKARHQKVQKSKHSATATSHNVRGHFAKNPGRKPGSHRVAAHRQADPGEAHKGGGSHELMIYGRSKGSGGKWSYVGSYSPSEGKRELALQRKNHPNMSFKADKVRFNPRTKRWVKTR